MKNSKDTKLCIILSSILLIFTLLLFFKWYLYNSTYNIEDKYDIIINKDIPVSWDNKKIVFVSDIHFGDYFPLDNLKKLIERINSLEPDIILFGGDFVGKVKSDDIPHHT